MDEFVFYADIHYSGRVQGVGFRYSTLQIVREFEVSGYVANLPNGRVRVEAEGMESEVLAFKKEIEYRLEAFIKKVECKTHHRPPQFLGFTIQ